MTVRVYRSDDASAPTLNGTVGSLIGVFDACLVNGYGAKAAAGWAKTYSGTNLAVYRAASGNRLFLRVDDTAAQEGRIVGYEAMSDVSTGTGPFPTSTQQSGGLFVRKSATADSTARPWVLVATGTAFYFLPNSSDTVLATGTVAGTSGHMFFGEFTSYKPGDAYNTAIIAAVATGNSVGRLGAKTNALISASVSTTTGHYVARGYNQTGTSIEVAKTVLGDWSNNATIAGTSSPAYPDVVSGGIPLGPLELIEAGANFVVRGRLPGCWGPLVSLPAAHMDTFSGSGELAGKTFLNFLTANATTQSRVALETSDTW